MMSITWLLLATGVTGGMSLVFVLRWLHGWLFTPPSVAVHFSPEGGCTNAVVMAALWVLLPFLFGCSQKRPRDAALLGLVATVAALFGYWAMTVSPMEGVALRSAPSNRRARARGMERRRASAASPS